MTLWLVRHGETDWNIKNRIQGRTDISLNEKGREQARQLGKRLKEEKIAVPRIYTSVLKRAMETAAILAEMAEIMWVAEEGLEEMNLGKWEGRTWKDIEAEGSGEFLEWLGDRRYTRTPQGESYQDLLDRFIPALCRILRKEQGNALVVTHSACIMTLLAYLNNTPFEDMWKNYRTGNTDICCLDAEEILRKCGNS